MVIKVDTLRLDCTQKILPVAALAEVCDQLRAQHRRIVATGGCFDIIHIGHVRSLQTARVHGDVLIVMVNSDVSVRTLKGPERPIVPEAERAEILAAFECVDFVVLFDEISPAATLAQLRPDFFCKGADYAPPNGKQLPQDEVDAVESYGGEIVFLPLVPQNSTTSIVNRIQQQCHADT